MKKRSFTTILFVLLSLMVSSSFASVPTDCACPELTMAQRWAGYLFSIGFLKLIGVAALAGGFMAVFGGVIKQVLYHARVLLEVIAYVVSGVLLASHWLIPLEYQGWTVMVGSLLFAGNVFATIFIHDIKGDDPKILSTLFMLVWGAVAIFYNMPEVGFLAVLALMTLFGFSVFVGNLSYAFGFENKASIPSGTTSALFVLTAFVVIKLFVPEAPDAVTVFAPGAFWAGSFVAFVGLLIMSNKYYIKSSGGSYFPMQFITNIILVGSVLVGTTYDLNALAGMAGTFFVFYWAAKPIEVPIDGMVSFGFMLMITGGILFGAWYWVQQHMDLIHQYLTTTV